MVKYKSWEKQSQPKIRMETTKRVAPLRLRKVKKEGTDLGFSSDSGTWFNVGEGFVYPPTALTSTNYPHISDKERGEKPEVNFDAHLQYYSNESTCKSMPEDEASGIELEINEGPYCPVCTPVGYRCLCKDEVLD